MPKNPLLRIAAPLFGILIIHIIATFAGWYESFWWFDIPMHLIGGAGVALSSYHLLQDYDKRNQFDSQSVALKILIITGFVAIAAVCWEFMEFTLDTYVNTNLQPGIADTMKDLANGLTGGGLVAVITSVRRKK